MEEKVTLPDGFIKNKLQEAELKKKIYDDTVHALQTEERFVNYFSTYEESTVKQFIEYYAGMKATWYTRGDMMVNYRQHQQTQWWKYAFECLAHIQHKKLFNLECEWRAEKIKAEGFEITTDFYLRNQNILDCKAVPPVSEEELNLYIKYLEELSDEECFLRQHNIGDSADRLRHNFYETENMDGNYPEWYRVFDRHFSTDILLALPDIRGEKEEFYKILWRKEKEPEWAAQEAARDKRPNMKYIYDREFAEWFLKIFETKETIELYHATRLYDDIRAYTEKIDMDIINLKEAEEYVSMENDEDWRSGIKRATEMYHRQKTIAILPEARKVYLQRVSDGKPAITKEDGAHDHLPDINLKNTIMEHILRGRELNGEPRDLNF